MGAAATSQHLPTTPPETDNTNAGGSLTRDETTDTTASSSPHTFETADTFARTKQPISGHFPPAKVSRVSCTPRRAPAKASPVSSDQPQLPQGAPLVSGVPTQSPLGQELYDAHASRMVARWEHDSRVSTYMSIARG